MTRLRPAKRQTPDGAAPKVPSAAALQNPYTRYYTAPRSLEQLVQQRRAEAAQPTPPPPK